jgi:hypothetical protein
MAKALNSMKVRRPMNSFMIFSTERRSYYRNNRHNAILNHKELSTQLGIEWHALTSESRNKYKEKAIILTEQHKLTYPNYKYLPRQNRSKKAGRSARSKRRPKKKGGAKRAPTKKKKPVFTDVNITTIDDICIAQSAIHYDNNCFGNNANVSNSYFGDIELYDTPIQTMPSPTLLEIEDLLDF